MTLLYLENWWRIPPRGCSQARAATRFGVPAGVRAIPVRTQHQSWGRGARAVRAATESDVRTTVLSVDGVGAYDHTSRQGQLSSIADRAELAGVLPFASMFVLRCPRHCARNPARRGRRGGGSPDALPVCPGSTRGSARNAVPLACLGHPVRMSGRHLLDRGPQPRCCSVPRCSKYCRKPLRDMPPRQNSCVEQRREEPPELLAALPPQDPEYPCWTGSRTLPAAKQGIVVLGNPVGKSEFVKARLEERLRDQAHLLDRIPHVPHLPSAWLLLLFCAAPRCTNLLRTRPPADTEAFAIQHDAHVRRCLATLLSGGEDGAQLPELSACRARLLLRIGARLGGATATGSILSISGRYVTGPQQAPSRDPRKPRPHAHDANAADTPPGTCAAAGGRVSSATLGESAGGKRKRTVRGDSGLGG